jgi:hypothetical protein
VSTDFTVWAISLLTLAVYSFLVKDNRAFRLTEKLFVGLGAGYSAALGYKNIVQIGITPVLQGRLLPLIPLILGLMAYTRYFKSVAWMSRIPVGLIVAIGAALTLRGSIQAQLIDQLVGSMVPWTSINNLIIVFGTASTIAYFYFRARSAGPFDTAMNWSGWFARLVMMIAFGIGYTGILGANIPRTIGQIQLIFGKWIKLIPGM